MSMWNRYGSIALAHSRICAARRRAGRRIMLAELAAADPAMPEGIINRAADNWRPLLSVADPSGGDWPERARRAATELSTEGDDQSSIRVALLADIRAAFAAKGVDRLSSDELATYLGSLDNRPWPEYRAGKPISKTQVAHLLKPLGISSGTIRLPDGTTPKGYYLTAFRDAFARYLPAENATTPQPQDFRGSAPDFKRHTGTAVAFRDCPKGRAFLQLVALWRIVKPRPTMTSFKSAPASSKRAPAVRGPKLNGGHGPSWPAGATRAGCNDAAPIHCRWCGRACRPRRGGSPRVFCTSGCRNAFHTAARRWAERAIAAGMLTIAELRNGDPAACTLLSGRLCGAEIWRHPPAAPAPAANPGKVAITVAPDRMTAMQLRELTRGDPHHPTREDLAKAASPLLR